LLREHLRVAPDVTEQRHYLPGAEDPSAIELRQGGGFARSVQADPALAGFIGACDGDLAVGQIIGALAELLQTDETALSGALLPAIRELALDGFVGFA
ncbi:MAG: SAM-dependent methyltransferase, partial [Microbacterium sp.]